MSIAAKQMNKTADKVIEALFKGGTIPSASTALTEIMKQEGIISTFGLPTFKATSQSLRAKSNVNDYNQNLMDFIFDVGIVYDEQIDQGTKVNRQLAASEIEFRKLMKDTKVVGDLANEVISSYDILQKHGFYVFDTFNNTDKLDLFRTTAFVDLEAGAIEIPLDRIVKIDLSHLRGQDTGRVTVMWPPEGRVSQVDGTRFGNM
jgi:hypothetical protein